MWIGYRWDMMSWWSKRQKESYAWIIVCRKWDLINCLGWNTILGRTSDDIDGNKLNLRSIEISPQSIYA